MRPIVTPGLRRLWRDGSTLQLGVDPARAVVVTGVAEAAAGVLELLDGTRSRRQVLGETSATGGDLMRLLEDGGLLDDATPDPPVPFPRPGIEHDRLAPDHASLSLLAPRPADPRHGARAVLARRQRAVVRVRGAGRVGAQTATLIAAAGVGSVLVDDAGVTRPSDVSPGGPRLDDVGRPRSVATGAAIGRACRPAIPRQRTPGAPVLPDLVLLTPPGLPVADLDEAADMRRSRVPHLLAGVLETTGVVGPFVLPGRSSCLTCQHLHRTDRDPAWPLLVTQLARRPDAGVDACDVTLAAAVAATAAMQALAWLDGRPGTGPPAAVGGSLELALPGWQFRRRTWPVHPGCGCAAV